MKNCILCMKLIDFNESFDLLTSFDEETTVGELIELHLAFIDLNNFQDNKVTSSNNNICHNCITNLKNFHEFYREIEGKYFKINDDELDIETNLFCPISSDLLNTKIDQSTNNENTYEELTIERLDLAEIYEDDKKIIENHSELRKNEEKILETSKKPKIDYDKLEINQDLEEEANDLNGCQNAIKISPENQVESRDKSITGEKVQISPKNQHSASIFHKNSQNQLKIPQNTKLKHQYTQNFIHLLNNFSSLPQNFNTKCDLCNHHFNSFQNAINHYQITHNQPGYLKCCDKKFKNRSTLIRHLEFHNDPTKFQCEICSKRLTSKNNLKMHTQTHSDNVEILICDICNKKFPHKYKLTAHMKNFHMNLFNFNCEKCEKNFKSKYQLENHLKSHTQVLFCCELCGKELKSSASLRNHMKNTHDDNIQRIKCTLCDHYLKNPYSLRKHMHRHRQMNENIKCELCNKPCTTKAALRSHMRMKHLLARNIPCRHCNKMFKQAIDRDEHESTHTKVDLYHCEFCPASFKFGANYRAHRKNSHAEEYERIKPKWLRPN